MICFQVALVVVIVAKESGANSVQRGANDDSLMMAALNGRQGGHHKTRREESISFGDRQPSSEQPWSHSSDVRNHGRAGSGRIGDTISFGDGGFRLGGFKTEMMSSGKNVNWIPKVDRSRCSSAVYCEQETTDEDYPAWVW